MLYMEPNKPAVPVVLLWSWSARARPHQGLALLDTALGVGWERKEGLWCLGLVMLSISAPPAWQLVPVTKNKDNFGAVVSFPRNIIFVALTAPPDRGEAVSKHSFLLGLREKCQIAEHCGNSFNGYMNGMAVMSPLVRGLVRAQCTSQSHSRNGPTDLFTVLSKPCSSTTNSKKSLCSLLANALFIIILPSL